MNYLRNLRPDNIPEEYFKRDSLAATREIILQGLYNIFLITITIGLPIFILLSPQVFISGKIWAYLLGFIFFVAIAINRKFNYYLRASFLIALFIGLGTAALINYGLSGTGIIFLFGSILLANLLFNSKISILLDILGVVPIIVIGSLMVTGTISLPPIDVMANSGNAWQWVIAVAVIIFAAGPIATSLLLILRGMNKALVKRESITEGLEASQVSLEQRVEERSADLKNRIAQFEIASQIAREISGETNLEGLLNTAVNQIRDRFGFYHVGVFLNDDKNEFSVLRAATGEAGRMMLERGHRLKIGEIGIVGYVAGRGEARISSNVADDVVHFKNPLLPETRSEIAIPLRTKEQIIGALDVQSVVMDAFTVDDISILQTIADQLSIAFEKTHLVEQLRRSVDELETTYRTNTQRAWRTHLRNTNQKLAYRYRNSRLENQADDSDHAREAQLKGQSVFKVVPGVKDEQGRPVTVLAIPIKLRNQVLGVVDIHFESASISPDLISLIEGTVSRLAVSLENARLMEEIQIRAERERMVGEISSKVRAASDVDSVLRIAIQEIGRSLGVSEVMVQLRKES